MLFEAWNHALKSTCGYFSAIPVAGQKAVSGHFCGKQMNGFDAAHFTCDIKMIERTVRDVRMDADDYTYLILQLAGSTRMESLESRVVLHPGDLYLIDSTRPVRMIVEGETSDCLSLHLPRALLFAEASSDIYMGKVQNAGAIASQRLHQHAYGLLLSNNTRSAPNPEFTLDLARAAFAAVDAGHNRMMSAASSRTRYEIATREIEIHAANPDMSLVWLATRIGVSPRQLERDFAGFNTSFVTTLRNQRLKLFLATIRLAQRSGQSARITDCALAAGFRDLSNFNRAFRSKFEVSPRAFLNNVGNAERPVATSTL